jgi:hypothetical protein
VGLLPLDPSNSSSSLLDEDSGPERRIPDVSQRNRREGKQLEKKDEG